MHVRDVGWLATLVLSLSSVLTARDLALIANKDLDLKNIQTAELVKVCKGQANHWPDGQLVTLVARDATTPDMKIALQKIYSMSAEEFNALVASANHGRNDRPAIVIVDSDEVLVKKVANTPGALGLVDVYSITGTINVVKIGGKLPLEPGYPLHGN